MFHSPRTKKKIQNLITLSFFLFLPLQSAYSEEQKSGFGLGFEKDMDNGMFIRAQVVGADYDDVEVTNANNTSVSVKAEDMIGAQASISVGKSF